MSIKFKMVLVLLLTPYLYLYAQEKPEVKIGGALRYNYNVSTWKPEQLKRGGDFGYEVFKLNTTAKYKGLSLNVDYRFYAQEFGGAMLKYGWIGYDFSENNNLQLGLTQVPFGITPFNSHSWFFSMNFYLGLEDDHDMGIKYTHIDDEWEYAIGFFKNAEDFTMGNKSDASDSRYAYDIGSLTDSTYRNKEINQFNLQLIRKISSGNSLHKIGVSALYGGIYNLDTEDIGDRYALAAHYELTAGRFDLKAQVTKYNFNPKSPVGESSDQIALTAYGAPYLIATEAVSYTLSAGYNVPVEWGPVSSLLFYNDFGMQDKLDDSLEDSFMNDLGVMITAGNVYTLVDAAFGKNQPWIGGDWTNSLSTGTVGADWEMRFNVNIGYYF